MPYGKTDAGWQFELLCFADALLRASLESPFDLMRACGADVANHRLDEDLLAGLPHPVFKIDGIVDLDSAAGRLEGPSDATSADLHENGAVGQLRGGHPRMKVKADVGEGGNLSRGTGIFQRVGAAKIGPAGTQIELAMVDNAVRGLETVMRGNGQKPARRFADLDPDTRATRPSCGRVEFWLSSPRVECAAVEHMTFRNVGSRII